MDVVNDQVEFILGEDGWGLTASDGAGGTCARPTWLNLLKYEYEMRWATPDEVGENRTDDETGKSKTLRSTKAEQGPPAGCSERVINMVFTSGKITLSKKRFNRLSPGSNSMKHRITCIYKMLPRCIVIYLKIQACKRFIG